jgi:hypothetical protein
MLFNPAVSSVMLRCAAEGVLLLPKHHAVTWTMPKPRPKPEEDVSGQSVGEPSAGKEAGGAATSADQAELKTSDHGGLDEAGGGVGTCSAQSFTSSEQVEALPPAAMGANQPVPSEQKTISARSNTKSHSTNIKIPKPPSSPSPGSEEQEQEAGGLGRRQHRDKLLADMQRLQDKRLKVGESGVSRRNAPPLS